MVRNLANGCLTLLFRARKEIENRLDWSPHLQESQTCTRKCLDVTLYGVGILAAVKKVKRVRVSEKLQVLVAIDHVLASAQE